MSFQLFKKDIIFYQRFLKSNGFYPHIIDGTWGPKTNKAEADFIASSAVIATQYGTFDTRSEANIITLAPKAQVAASIKCAILCSNYSTTCYKISFGFVGFWPPSTIYYMRVKSV